ncbi:MAG: hypothetical protein ACLFPM_04885 [Candidatus Izemoplasmatales bacterium]
MKRVKSNKLVALSPFISIILFFILGFGFGYWEYGWLVFLLIPITGVLSSRSPNKLSSLIEVTPFISLGVFLTIGLIYDVWHPTWVVFLLIPAVAILDTKDRYKYLSFTVFILGPILYVLSYYFYPFQFNWFLLFLMGIPAIYSGLISFRINGVRNRRLEVTYGSFLILLALIYVLLGSIYAIWHPLWLIFLLVPMAAVILSMSVYKQKVPFVALSPFIAVILFVLTGELFDGYSWSWLFFFIIPMTALFSRQDKKFSWVGISVFLAITLFFIAGQFLNGYEWSWLFFLLIPMTAIISE